MSTLSALSALNALNPLGACAQGMKKGRWNAPFCFNQRKIDFLHIMPKQGSFISFD
ncbi:hypothetical protein [Allofranklinella schreckenbergeri]|uniref:hypothetical protein n=1 Tax=Allofranklinella schreckenbergeri TaxID=1076744 RepID=UPI001EED8889|nr:hypothetical protein [Allofranklinella schreckenbergeri]